MEKRFSRKLLSPVSVHLEASVNVTWHNATYHRIRPWRHNSFVSIETHFASSRPQQSPFLLSIQLPTLDILNRRKTWSSPRLFDGNWTHTGEIFKNGGYEHDYKAYYQDGLVRNGKASSWFPRICSLLPLRSLLVCSNPSDKKKRTAFDSPFSAFEDVRNLIQNGSEIVVVPWDDLLDIMIRSTRSHFLMPRQ